MSRALTSTASTFLVVLCAGCGGSGGTTPEENAYVEPPPPGVSALSYSPKPFFADMTEMKVRFTTTGSAGPGRKYAAYLIADKKVPPNQNCYGENSSTELVRGAAGLTYEVTLSIHTGSGSPLDDEPFCAGTADLVVSTRNVRGREDLGDFLREMQVRIRPARMG